MPREIWSRSSDGDFVGSHDGARDFCGGGRGRRNGLCVGRGAGVHLGLVERGHHERLAAGFLGRCHALVAFKAKFGLVKMKGVCYEDGQKVVEGDFQFAMVK